MTPQEIDQLQYHLRQIDEGIQHIWTNEYGSNPTLMSITTHVNKALEITNTDVSEKPDAGALPPKLCYILAEAVSENPVHPGWSDMNESDWAIVIEQLGLWLLPKREEQPRHTLDIVTADIEERLRARLTEEARRATEDL